MEYIKDHSERKHALLSPSSSNRWLVCTASARAAENFDAVDHVSEASEEGTTAHELAEYNLGLYLKGEFIPFIDDIAVQPELYGNKYVTNEMKDFVLDYIGYVTDIYEKIAGGVMYLEKKFDLSRFVPDSAGSADVSIVSPEKVVIIDLKYGKGVRVDAHKNSQIMMYALGVWNELTQEQQSTVKTISMHIAQIRLGAMTEYTLTPDALLLWAEEVLIPRAEIAFTGHGATFVTGDHCKYCKFKPVCRKHKDELLEAFDTANETAALTLDEIGELLSKMEVFNDWIASVQAYAYEKVNAGENVPGWKLVEGRSVRRIVEQGKAVEVLRGLGLTDDDIFYTTIKSITDIERKIGKRAFAVHMSDVVKKIPGKPVLAKESDKREAVKSIINEFDEI